MQWEEIPWYQRYAAPIAVALFTLGGVYIYFLIYATAATLIVSVAALIVLAMLFWLVRAFVTLESERRKTNQKLEN